MRFSSVLLALLLPLAISAAPTTKADNSQRNDNCYVSCSVWGEDARNRACPRASCDLKALYHKGHWENFYCYTWGDYVHGNKYATLSLIAPIYWNFRSYKGRYANRGFAGKSKWYKDYNGCYSNAYWWGSCTPDGKELYSLVFEIPIHLTKMIGLRHLEEC